MCGSSDNKVSLGVGLRKTRDTENNSCIFSLEKLTTAASGADIKAYSGNFTVAFTVTKIEQYY